MGNDIQKGTTYATGGVGGQGSITSANLNAHVDDATIKSTFITSKAARAPGVLTDQILLESGGALYKMLLSTLQSLLVTSSSVPAGSVIQTVAATPYTTTTALGTIPLDDTVPQIGEGTEILTLSITPQTATNKIRLRFNGFGAVDTTSIALIAALFRTGVSNALKTTSQVSQANHFQELNIDYLDSPASVSAQTYTIRAGTPSNNGVMNGHYVAGRFFGGAAACTLIAEEVKA